MPVGREARLPPQEHAVTSSPSPLVGSSLSPGLEWSLASSPRSLSPAPGAAAAPAGQSPRPASPLSLRGFQRLREEPRLRIVAYPKARDFDLGGRPRISAVRCAGSPGPSTPAASLEDCDCSDPPSFDASSNWCGYCPTNNYTPCSMATRNCHFHRATPAALRRDSG